MSDDWETIFRLWAKPPGVTEQTKCENAERMVKSAISNNEKLAKMDTSTFVHGSYRAHTNVRQDSDVDICVCLKSTFFYALPSNSPNTPEYYEITPGGMPYQEFKALVEVALVDKFGRRAVTRGSKAFDIRENTYRVDADVIAAFEHRRYTGQRNPDGTNQYLSGIELRPDQGERVVNWPQQTYENGVSKNAATGGRYKSVIRVLKRLRNQMQEEGIAQAREIASFLIECLVWNTPDAGFGHQRYLDDVRYVLAHTFNETLHDLRCKEWGEVNELKYLLRSSQPWTREQAHSFLSAAWDYLGFE